MTETNETGEPRTNMDQLKTDAEACGPECACNTGTPGKGRWLVGAIVIVVAGVLVARAAMKDNAAQAQSPGTDFAMMQSTGTASVDMSSPEPEPTAAVETSAKTASPQTIDAVNASETPQDAQAEAASPQTQEAVNASETPQDGQAEVGEPNVLAKPEESAPLQVAEASKTDKPGVCGELIRSLGDLNQKAMDKDGVFVFLAGQDADKNSAIVSVVEKGAATLKGRNITMGTFTLEPGTSEFTNLSKQVSPPCVLAMAKGRGASAVQDDITEAKLMQAFVTAANAGGGCGASCGPSKAGCK